MTSLVILRLYSEEDMTSTDFRIEFEAAVFVWVGLCMTMFREKSRVCDELLRSFKLYEQDSVWPGQSL